MQKGQQGKYLYSTEQNEKYSNKQIKSYGLDQNKTYGLDKNKKYSNEQNKTYGLEQNKSQWVPFARKMNREWQFQKVHSVYETQKEQFNNSQQGSQQTKAMISFPKRTPNLINQCLDRPKYQPVLFSRNTQNKMPNNQRQQQQKVSNTLSYQVESQTNMVSQSPSLQYLSSQQPSFSSKTQFTVLEHFDLENQFPLINKNTHQFINPKNEWNIASFAPKISKTSNIQDKCHQIFQFIQQLKFIKESFQSKLKQQKIYLHNQLQDVKKLIFKLNIKYEKQMIQFNKLNHQHKKLSSSRLSIQSEDSNQNQIYQLRLYCQKLQEQRQSSQEKYAKTLKNYQSQIEIISQELQKKIRNQNQQNSPSFQSKGESCQNCIKLEQIISSYQGVDQQVEHWKNSYIEQHKRNDQAMKRVQQQIFILQQELSFMEKSKVQVEKKLKQKQRQVLYQQSEIQYRIKDIEKRQRDLQMAQVSLKKQKDDIQAKKQIIANHQFKVIKQERRQKNQVKDKQILSSEYFTSSNNERPKICYRENNHNGRNDSVSSKGSRIDINARLREIQMMKGKGKRNYDDSITSRNSSKDEYSGFKDYKSSRVSTSSMNLKDYGVNLPLDSYKQHKRESSQSIKLSQKLTKLTQKLQNQLNQMN